VGRFFETQCTFLQFDEKPLHISFKTGRAGLPIQPLQDAVSVTWQL